MDKDRRIAELEAEIKSLKVQLELFAGQKQMYKVWNIQLYAGKILELYAPEKIVLCSCNGSLHELSLGCM